MEKKILPYLVVFSAISVSLSAAFYSVTGIGKMFSGSSTNVMIMMASLEVAKLILASLLYQYWGKLNKLLKVYYIIAIFVLMVITSAGIYGYLSSAYSETSNKVENIDRQVSNLNVKRDFFIKQISDLNSEKKMISDDISNLTSGLSNNQQSYKDKNGNIITSSSSSNRKSFENQLKYQTKRRDDISNKESSLNDSILSIDMKKLNLESNSDIAGEVGPLKYIAKLTGRTIDQVINWFIIALMLVFDPLAVSLVIGANIIFKDKNKEEENRKKFENFDEKINEFDKREKEFNKLSSEFDSRLKKINQEEEKLNKNKLEIEELREKLNELENSLDIREKNYNKNILQAEKEYKLKLDEDRIKLYEDINRLNIEKHKLFELETKLKNDFDEANNLSLSLNEKERDIENRELELNKTKEELINLDNEIKSWEAQNFKMKRMNRPPSSL